MFVKKIFLIIILLLFPLVGYGLSIDDARHLLGRTGFDVQKADLNLLAEMSRLEAVDHILSQQKKQTVTPYPKWINDRLIDRKKHKNRSKKEKKAMRQKMRQKGMELHSWWYNEMLITNSPLTERMTLFWHSHFTSSIKKVKSPQLMFKQNQLLRQNALGRFSDLLHQISFDPAMLIYLDNRSNKKKQPNENYARELLELFTLGEGHYTEGDIKNAARAFTGHSFSRKNGRYQFKKKRHDNGDKAFMGRHGNLDAKDILNILLDHDQTARHITGKLWKEFVTTEIKKDELLQYSESFKRNDYRIDSLVKNILLSDDFWHINNRGTRVKSPVELIVGTLRFLKLPIYNSRRLYQAARSMGQVLLSPPNVKGWPGGLDWIDSDLLLKRQEVLERLTHSKMYKNKFSNVKNDNSKIRTSIKNRLLSIAPVNELDINKSKNLSVYIRAILLDPVYQLN